MQVQLERYGAPGTAGAVKFSLRKGSEGDFRCLLSPYGWQASVPSSRAPETKVLSQRDFLVPAPAAMLACAALSKTKTEIFAAKEVQAIIRSAAWKCNVPGLYGYQKSGAEFLRSRRRAILADDMGTGKTAQSLSALDVTKAALIIAPPVVLGSWYQEARRWRPDFTTRIWEPPYGIWFEPGEICIVPYSKLPYESIESRLRCPTCGKLSAPYVDEASVLVEEFTEEDWRGIARTIKRWSYRCDKDRGGLCGQGFTARDDEAEVEHVWVGARPKHAVQLIVDEAHWCKNRDAKRTIGVRTIAAQCWTMWMLTGTPLLNEPMELWTLFQAFPGQGRSSSGASDAFGSFPKFVEMFHGKRKFWGGYDWAVDDEVEPEARARFATLALRRTRQEVLPELPEKTRRFLEIAVDVRGMPQWGEAADLARLGDDEVLGACAPEGSLSTVRRELASRKLKTLEELIEEYEAVGEPVVVFSYHKDPIKRLGERKGWACITGETNDRERTARVAAFQEGKLKGLAGTIGAMGVGVTLTRSSNMLFLDRDFVPANNLQAEDREMRIGQKRAVLITILVTDHPVDRRVRAVLEKKERLLEALDLSEGSSVRAEVATRMGKGSMKMVGKVP
jgi:hypothetical protein